MSTVSTYARFARMWLIGFVLCGNLCADNLETLENILSRAPSLQDFLADPDLREQYRDAYKRFMGYDDQFDAGYEQILDDLTEIARHYPNFGVRAWASDPLWKEAGFEISADGVSNGLQLKPGALPLLLSEMEAELAQLSSRVQALGAGGIQAEIDVLEGIYLSQVPQKSLEEVEALNDLEKSQFRNSIVRKTQELLRNPDFSSRLRELSAAISLELFGLPATKQALRTPISGMVLDQIKNILSREDLKPLSAIS